MNPVAFDFSQPNSQVALCRVQYTVSFKLNLAKLSASQTGLTTGKSSIFKEISLISLPNSLQA